MGMTHLTDPSDPSAPSGSPRPRLPLAPSRRGREQRSCQSTECFGTILPPPFGLILQARKKGWILRCGARNLPKGSGSPLDDKVRRSLRNPGSILNKAWEEGARTSAGTQAREQIKQFRDMKLTLNDELERLGCQGERRARQGRPLVITQARAENLDRLQAAFNQGLITLEEAQQSLARGRQAYSLV